MPMDFEAWKEFMAEQQAQFWADLRAIEARQAETARLADENRQHIATLVQVCMSLTTHAQETDRQLKETGELIRELRDAQAHSDQRLDALINVVDALVKRNGKHD